MATKSVLQTILEAVQTTLRSCTLASINDNNIVIRAIRTDRDLTLPGAVISPGPQETDPRAGTLAMDDVAYGVYLDFVDADNQSHANIDKYALWLQTASRAFRNQRLSGVTSVGTCEVVPGPPIDRDAWISNKFVGSLLLRFTSREPRGVA